ncbi:ATP-binding protein [Thalassolituus oleivorans]|uniref:ATP-binding protein n=1 Tax=Thalassolituus oleivorans TaxID=187493 RepID=UPI000AE6E80A|nr:ATP-binding protein [Thalassolituus oleivorans]
MMQDSSLNEQDSHTNADNLSHAFDYLAKVFAARIEIHQGGEDVVPALPELAFYEDGSAFATFIEQHKPSFEEYIVLLLALVPHVMPGFLDTLFADLLPEKGRFAEFGGNRDNVNQLFQPTGETALYLLAGRDLNRRFLVQKLFSADHWLVKNTILYLQPAKPADPFFSGRIVLNPDYVELFTTGKISTPHFSAEFPAQQIYTELEWGDLVLSPTVKERIDEIRLWVENNHILMNEWQMAAKFKPGFRALFFGPPGTGKTMTATLLGKHTGKPVFRVDLSTIVSKYIGETEKNLSSLFDQANARDWILFFDEADALFGKRTGVKDAHDRFANQEVSYLLQKVEQFDGLVILASNLKTNIDEAFLRRFNAVIPFAFPNAEERKDIWQISMPPNTSIDGIDNPFEELARYELAGGSIINVLQYACLQALGRGRDRTLVFDDLLKGIALEMEKHGKVFRALTAVKTELAGI